MALSIRLARVGAKKRPQFRVVVADSRYPRDGRFIEKLGTYNPMLPKDSKERVTLELERIKHSGATCGSTVSRTIWVQSVRCFLGVGGNDIPRGVTVPVRPKHSSWLSSCRDGPKDYFEIRGLQACATDQRAANFGQRQDPARV